MAIKRKLPKAKKITYADYERIVEPFRAQQRATGKDGEVIRLDKSYKCQRCGIDSENIDGIFDVEYAFGIVLCGECVDEWITADLSLTWFFVAFPERLLIKQNCPQCHRSVTIPDDDYICAECRQ